MDLLSESFRAQDPRNREPGYRKGSQVNLLSIGLVSMLTLLFGFRTKMLSISQTTTSPR